MRRVKLFLPLVLFGLLGVLLWRGLSLDPKALPSALLDDPLPEFTLTELNSGKTLSRGDIIGEPMLVNVWATWCYSCRVEHPYLVELGKAGVRIVGLNYKDDSAPARKWLTDLGDPYVLTLADTEGTLGLDLGVYGAPETYVVDAEGMVRHRHVGVVDEGVWIRDLAPFFKDGGFKDVGFKDVGFNNAGVNDAGVQGADLQDSGLQGSDLKGAGLKDSGMKDSGMKDSGMKSSGLEGAESPITEPAAQ